MPSPTSQKISPEEVSLLALRAAKEISRGLKRNKDVQALAGSLRRFFVPKQGGWRPMLQPESIGLVCGVLEKWKGDNRPAQYHVLSEVTEEIAKKLETTNPKSNDLDKLQKFCLLLHEATKTRPELYDIPPQHRYFAPLA